MGTQPAVNGPKKERVKRVELVLRRSKVVPYNFTIMDEYDTSSHTPQAK